MPGFYNGQQIWAKRFSGTVHLRQPDIWRENQESSFASVWNEAFGDCCGIPAVKRGICRRRGAYNLLAGMAGAATISRV
ncbi:MAG: hypothetical protein E4H02_08880 [Lentisphaerales bacterium]|nr:MAG: hypothetical protein E4H02_08880 [Lentisphaerales bacterium]